MEGLSYFIFDVSFAKRQRNKLPPQKQKTSGREFLRFLPADDDAAFSEWSDWSKCNYKCEKSIIRHCIRPEICENKNQTYHRNCPRCKKKNLRRPVENYKEDKLSEDLDRKIFSQWSDWSPCDSSCYTWRTRKCIKRDMCNGRFKKKQSRECYIGGDDCEKRYFALNPRNSTKQNYSRQILKDNEHPLNNISCGISKVPIELRIAGGRRAIKGAWPWQVVILNEYQQPFCGGVILNRHWVLTAAHCARHELTVRAGEHDLSYFEGTEQEYAILDVFVYHKYKPMTGEGDIALLKMEYPFEFNRFVQPICLPEEGENIPPYARATIIGWGNRRNETNYGTDILHQADVPVVSDFECRASYSQYIISNKMLCAGFASGRVDSCRGDSGGPLMDKRPDGAWAVYGVTSFGDGCGRRRKYGVYASVPAHLKWIKDIIKYVETNENTIETPTEQTMKSGTGKENFGTI